MKKQREYLISDAGDLARQRFFAFLDEKIKKDEWDTTKWEFFTFLLEQAKNHELDFSGYGSLEYQRDRREAKDICQKRNEERRTMIQEFHEFITS